MRREPKRSVLFSLVDVLSQSPFITVNQLDRISKMIFGLSLFLKLVHTHVEAYTGQITNFALGVYALQNI